MNKSFKSLFWKLTRASKKAMSICCHIVSAYADLNVASWTHEDYSSTHETAAWLVCDEMEIYTHFHPLLGHLVHELWGLNYHLCQSWRREWFYVYRTWPLTFGQAIRGWEGDFSRESHQGKICYWNMLKYMILWPIVARLRHLFFI